MAKLVKTDLDFSNRFLSWIMDVKMYFEPMGILNTIKEVIVDLFVCKYVHFIQVEIKAFSHISTIECVFPR